MALMRRIDPDMIRIAKYSPRPLTYSARHLPDDVPEAEKNAAASPWKPSSARGSPEKRPPARPDRRNPRRNHREKRTPPRAHPDYKPVFVDGSSAVPGDLVIRRWDRCPPGILPRTFIPPRCTPRPFSHAPY
jgi:hypothetical protein